MASTYIIDGGLSTQLECQGVDLKKYPKLWTAGLLGSKEGHAQLLNAHLSYLNAGADIILTASYQTSADTKKDLLAASVDLAIEARDTVSKGKVFVSLGPWGATQADGSEYTGNYPSESGEDFLFQFHKTRLSLLLENRSVDGLAFETIPSTVELFAILKLLATDQFNFPTWISFSTPNGTHLCDGTPFEVALTSCLQQFSSISLTNSPRYLGLNCVHPSTIDSFLDIIIPLTQKYNNVLNGIVLYPNNGGTWDSEKRCWVEDGVVEEGVVSGFCNKAVEWRDTIVGAGLICFIGGCCSTHASTILELKSCLTSE
jgi:homocysteine S-methyltransferase